MKKLRTLVDVEIPYFFKQVLSTLKVILIEVVIILMALGVLYITNFHVTIERNVISPIGGK